MNRHQARHIVTIEDPIEYLFQNDRSWFSQREVRRDTDNFSVALRAALRQNPDIILFGEIRDADREVEAFLDEIDVAVREAQRELHLGVALGELRHLSQEVIGEYERLLTAYPHPTKMERSDGAQPA